MLRNGSPEPPRPPTQNRTPGEEEKNRQRLWATNPLNIKPFASAVASTGIWRKECYLLSVSGVSYEQSTQSPAPPCCWGAGGNSWLRPSGRDNSGFLWSSRPWPPFQWGTPQGGGGDAPETEGGGRGCRLFTHLDASRFNRMLRQCNTKKRKQAQNGVNSPETWSGPARARGAGG